MSIASVWDRSMARPKKPKAASQPQKYGIAIRVSPEFAEAVREAASLKKVSIAEHVDGLFLTMAQAEHAAVLLRAVERQAGKNQSNS